MVLLKPKEKSPSIEGLFLRLLFVCGILNKKEVKSMKIGDAAANILPDYTLLGKDVVITSVHENPELCCVCIGLSDGTWWFIDDDTVLQIPCKTDVTRIIHTDKGYAWDDGILIPWLIGL